MLAGNLRDRIILYNETREDANEFSERRRKYIYAFPTRAEVSFVSGSEVMYNQMQFDSKAMKFKVRFGFSRYNEHQIIKWRDDYYNVKSIDPDRRRTYLILTAERVAKGLIRTEINQTAFPAYFYVNLM